MSGLRELCSRRSISATKRRLCAKNGARLSKSPSTSAERMKMSRARSGSNGANGTRRFTYTGSPYSVPRSSATTSPRSFSQCGSVRLRFSRCAPISSSQRGSIEATVRAKRRVVSTSSAATIHLPGFFVHEPGWIQNWMPRAPV